MSSLCTSSVHSELKDPEWDEFVARHPAGTFGQSSLWASVKAHSGWERLCVQLCDETGIVAGAQILARPLPFGGMMGYATQSPLLATSDPELQRQCVEAIQELARAARIRFLLMQPCEGGEAVGHTLCAAGFQPDLSGSIISTSLIVDLEPDEEVLFRNLRKRRRQLITAALGEGIEVCQGGFGDLPKLHSLMLETCRRQGVTPHPPTVKLFEHMWESFDPTGAIHVLLASYRGRVEAAQLLVSFGSRVSPFKVGWSGRAARFSPAQVMDWVAIRDAKRAGYARYDFMGIDPKVQETDRSEWRHLPGPTFYKLGFGGRIVTLPPALEYVSNPALRFGYRHLVRPLRSSGGFRAATSWLWSRLHKG